MNTLREKPPITQNIYKISDNLSFVRHIELQTWNYWCHQVVVVVVAEAEDGMCSLGCGIVGQGLDLAWGSCA